MVAIPHEPPLDWARPFALFNPLNKVSHDAVKTRLNRRQRVDASRYRLRNHIVVEQGVVKRKAHCLAKLDFKTILGRHCATLGASRASSIKLPRNQGICSEHLLLHFDLGSKSLLLTDTSATGTYVKVGNGKLSLLRHQTVTVSGCTYIKLGTHGQFEFDIEPTMFHEGFDRLVARWLKSSEGPHPGPVASEPIKDLPCRPLPQRVHHPRRVDSLFGDDDIEHRSR